MLSNILIVGLLQLGKIRFKTIKSNLRVLNNLAVTNKSLIITFITHHKNFAISKTYDICKFFSKISNTSTLKYSDICTITF